MTWSAICREAWRNIASGAARPWLLAALATVVMLSAQLADLATVAAGDARADAFRAAGADVLVLQSAGGIDATRCSALEQVPGVEASGAIRSSEPTFAASAPHSSIPTFEVTSLFGAVLGANTTGPGVLLSADAADMLDVEPGRRVPLVDGSTHVAGVFDYPSDGRMLGLGFSILVPSSDMGPFDACWMRAWPAVDEHQLLLQTVASSVTDAPPEMRQLNARLGAELDAASAFRDRPTRMLPLAAAAALGGIAAGAVLLRRLEFASARHLGVSREALTTIVLGETILWLLPGLLAAAVTGAIAVSALGAEDIAAGIGLATLAPGGGALGALIGGAVAAASIRERDVYRSFRLR